jgi:hypothetical protein
MLYPVYMRTRIENETLYRHKCSSLDKKSLSARAITKSKNRPRRTVLNEYKSKRKMLFACAIH